MRFFRHSVHYHVMLLCTCGCRTSKELKPEDDEKVIVMKAIIDTDVAVEGLVIVHCHLHLTHVTCIVTGPFESFI